MKTSKMTKSVSFIDQKNTLYTDGVRKARINLHAAATIGWFKVVSKSAMVVLWMSLVAWSMAIIDFSVMMVCSCSANRVL